MVLENSLRAFFLTFLRTIPFSRQVTAEIQIKILSARGSYGVSTDLKTSVYLRSLTLQFHSLMR